MTNLIITNPEVFYEKDKKNIFLGEWCYLRPDSLVEFKNTLLFDHYHWDDLHKKRKDFDYLLKLIDKTLDNIKISFNENFKVNYSNRYYNILICPWISKFILHLFDRWEIIKSFSKIHEDAYVNIYSFDDKEFIPLDTETALYHFNTSDWNHWIFSKIISCQKKIRVIEKTQSKSKNSINLRKKEKNNKFNLINLFLKKLSSNTLFIKDFQLSPISRLFLHLKHRNFIFYPENISYPDYSIDFGLRNKLFEKKEYYNSFESFLFDMLKINFPKIFLEGFMDSKNLLKKLNWLNNPKKIITSYCYQSDEVFKYYTAENVERNKSKYFISQHGGSWGFLEFKLFEKIVAKMSNNFLSWGHIENDNYTIPTFLTKKNKNRYSNKINPSGVLIPMTEFENYPSNIETIRSRKDTIKFMSQFESFIKKLNDKILIQSKIKYRNPFQAVKLPDESKKGVLLDGLNFIEEILENKYKNNLIKSKKTSIEISQNFKLIVEFLNGTGFLECMANNIPVILIMSSEYNRLNNKAKKMFKKLKDSNIYFEDFEMAASFINLNYNKIDSWWNSKLSQESRLEFVNNFAKIEKHHKKMSSIIEKL